MGLDNKYQLVTSGFEKYYEEFLRNSVQGLRYQITLRNGNAAVGVPSAGSMVNPHNLEDTTFYFRDDSGKSYQIPFRDLKEAKKLT